MLRRGCAGRMAMVGFSAALINEVSQSVVFSRDLMQK